jgi:maltose alpha-D-glucosyltransferase/alpha-amylase
MSNDTRQAASTDDPLWYKDAIIYELHVKAFFDSTNDGVGDFPGLTEKLDYLHDLGITCIWLLPFYPSPMRDDGYDIGRYDGVHPAYGTLRDFRQFLREAHARGLQVITELVVNHTSDEHPWFQAARRAPKGSSKRDFYVWSETKQKYQEARIIFTDSETSNWTWDHEAQAYYWHRFFHHQPDLNYDNPRVRQAILRAMRFWLDMGVDGMRLDAVPYLIEREGTNCENLPETHDVLRTLRAELDARYANRVLLAEANQWPADVRFYMGEGDECHMAYHFPLMPRIFMALRQEDRHPITEILDQTPDIPEACQWALFLRNHDELTLEMVTDEERDYMYNMYAADPQMRVNVGIRRRLAPLMENSRRRIELLNSLLFSLPGSPIVYYGDEIGMGDNIYLGDRNGVRTPMQWTGDRNAGFSRADPARLYAPLIMDPVYGYQGINVEAQERSPFSLLNWMKRMIAMRKRHQTFGRGSLRFLSPRNRKVLAYVRQWGDETILAVANLSRTVQPVELDLSGFRGLVPIEMLGRTDFPRIGELPYFLTLTPYGFYWFELSATSPPPDTKLAAPTVEQVDARPALMTSGTWETMLDGHVRRLIERDCLGPYLERQRWFGGKGRAVRASRIDDWTVVTKGAEPAFLCLVDVTYEDGGQDRYFVTLAARSGEAGERLLTQSPETVLARITGARKGVLCDACAGEAVGADLLKALADSRTFPTRRGAIRTFATSALTDLLREHPPAGGAYTITRGPGDQSNTSLLYDDRLILKLFRRLEPGINPDLEVQLHLAEHVGFSRVPRVLGGLEYRGRTDASSIALGLLQQFVQNQGNAWDYTIGEIGRFFDQTDPVGLPGPDLPLTLVSMLAPPEPAPSAVIDTVGAYLETAATLGRRTAELHLALARDAGNPAFTPEPAGADDVARWTRSSIESGRASLATLEAHLDRLPSPLRERARLLLARRWRVDEVARKTSGSAPAFSKIRVHGDFHLGQLLWTESDFVVLDFEGEPARSLEERREKQPALKDVAGMLRSFAYAAAVGLTHEVETRPTDEDRLRAWAGVWQAWTSASFLAAYRATAAGAVFLPAAPEEFEALLRLFLLDKALYELRYELGHRPDWVDIPVDGLLALLSPPLSGSEA